VYLKYKPKSLYISSIINILIKHLGGIKMVCNYCNKNHDIEYICDAYAKYISRCEEKFSEVRIICED
jgi:hypothetical protein